MKPQSLALAALLGLTAPAAIEVAIERPALAQRRPIGTFQDNAWEVSLDIRNGSYVYSGRALGSDDVLQLRGGTFGGTPSRRVYRWFNGIYTYQIAWQPRDPNFVRLQVFEGNVEILNRLLERI